MIHRKWLISSFLCAGGLLAAPGAWATPTCTSLSTGSTSIGDVYVASGSPTSNLQAAQASEDGSRNGKTYYALLAIDVNFIPKSSVINSATVTLYQEQTWSPGSTVNVDYVENGWNPSTVTWDNFTAAYSTTPVATFLSGSGPVSFDLTSLTQAWVSGAIANNGILLTQSVGATVYDFTVAENLQIFTVCYSPAAPAPVNPSLTLEKSVNTVTSCPGNASVTVAPGAEVTECYTVTNTGDVPVSGIVVNDSGATVSIGTLAAGASATGSITAPANAFSDTAAVASGTAGSAQVTSSTSSAPINVLASSLSVQKTVSLTGACPGTTSVTVMSGTTVTYCYAVTNTGQVPLSDVVVNDSGATVTIGTLAPGASGSGSASLTAAANSNAPAIASGVDSAGEGVSSPQSAAAVNLFGLVPNCESSGIYDTISNPGSPAEQVGTCASGDGLTLAEAIEYCGGNVQYFAYTCTDFPASLPDQPQNQRAWTGDFGCCAAPGGPTCSDGIMDGTETDVDCGGQCPISCVAGLHCNYDTDCETDYCHNGICQVAKVLDATCVNNGLNDTLHNVGWPAPETGTCQGGYEPFTIDDAAAQCGGVVKYFDFTCTDFPNPPPYAPQRTWEADFSCCEPLCSDGIQDGNESDVDCGQQCPLQCYPGQTCVCNTDCRDNNCVPNSQGVYVCQDPPVLAGDCTNDGTNATIYNPGSPAHQVGTCPCGGFFTIQDAAALCPGNVVKYFDYTCTDFPAVPPYQPEPEYAWEADYSCCVPGSIP